MEYFLDTIASSLYKEFGNTLNRHCLVFPNRRAGLFFIKYLASHINKPVWEPSVLTINELFRSNSSLQIAASEVLLFELYKVYRKHKKSAESFDNFFYWGDVLLNDFDDVDKYLVDASLLFKNVLDIKNIDQQFGGLSQEQIEIIRKFWINFNPEKLTDQKTGFISIWSVLNDIYCAYRTSLREQNMAYEGMIFRDLAENEMENFSSGEKWDQFHFIGFNALNECEKRVMSKLKKLGIARFYWDYDESFLSETGSNSAGYFLRNNLRIYGNDMPDGWNNKTFLTSTAAEVKRQVIDTSSDVAQVKLVPDLLKGFTGLTSDNAHQTAVVLSDENLLIPLLTSLPEEMGDVNITMGYPLKQTSIYTLVRNMMDLQRNSVILEGKARFRYRDVAGLLKNSLVTSYINSSADELLDEITKSNLLTIPEDYFRKNEKLAGIFTRQNSPTFLSAYFRDNLSGIASSGLRMMEKEEGEKNYSKILNEFIYRIVLSVNMLDTIVRSDEIIFSGETYMLILDRMLRMQSIPFAGEPLSGIQVMGILETRALDFKNLIILSVNEGVLPAVSSPSSSYIPFSLREAFGLPSVNHQESIYAYHFYRLLQRAENVTFVYNSNSEGLRSGEMSRFLIQMMYNPQLKPVRIEMNPEIRLHGSINEEIERHEWHNNLLLAQYAGEGSQKLLSPSAVNTWLSCRMKFYYRYVNGLKEPEQLKSEIDPAMLGDILHEIMRKLYADYEGKILDIQYLKSLLKGKQILMSAIDDSVKKRFQSGEENIEHGNEIIVRDVLLTYLIRILNADISVSPVNLVSLERKYTFPLVIDNGNKKITLNIGGIVDRIDILNGTARIVDYKTGSVSDSPGSLSDLFTDDRKKDSDGWLQTLIYCEAVYGKIKADFIRPSIYRIKKGSAGILSDKLKLKTDSGQEIVIDDYAGIRTRFIDNLKETLELVFSNEEPFRMTDDTTGKCRYCIYRGLCQR